MSPAMLPSYSEQHRDADTLRALLPDLPAKSMVFAQSLLDGPYGLTVRGYWSEKQWACVRELIEATMLCMSVQELRKSKGVTYPFPGHAKSPIVGGTHPNGTCACGNKKPVQYPTCFTCYIAESGLTGAPVSATKVVNLAHKHYPKHSD